MTHINPRIIMTHTAAALVAGVSCSHLHAQCGPQYLSVAVPFTANGRITALAEYTGGLIAAGEFTTIGGVAANRIARWDGVAWTPLGSGLGTPPTTFQSGIALAVFNNQLVAGGDFNTARGAPFDSVSRWDGSVWTAMSGGSVPGNTTDLAVIGAGLFAANQNGRVRMWDGSQWLLINWPSGSIGVGSSALTVFNNRLIVAHSGLFLGGATVNIGQYTPGGAGQLWNGTWQAMGTGVNNPTGTSNVITDLAVYAGSVYAIGSFTAAGGVANTNNMARWNGTAWSSVSTGTTNGFLGGLGVYDGALFMSGSATLFNGFSAGFIARRDATQWLTTPGLSTNGAISAMLPFKGEFVLGGQISSPSQNIARWTSLPVPWVARQPSPQSVDAGQTVTLNATPAMGYAGLQVQWRRNDLLISNGAGGSAPGGGTVSGANGALVTPSNGQPATLTISGAQPSDSGLYKAVFTNACGSAESVVVQVTVQQTMPDCGPADVGGQGGIAGADGQLDNNDFVVFVNLFFTGSAGADVGSQGGLPGADGLFDNNDFVVFINQFFAGCN